MRIPKEALQLIAETQSPSLFLDQTTHAPGLREFLELWPEICRCGDENCARQTLQHHAARWHQRLSSHDGLEFFLLLMDGNSQASILHNQSPKDGLIALFDFCDKASKGDPKALSILKEVNPRKASL